MEHVKGCTAGPVENVYSAPLASQGSITFTRARAHTQTEREAWVGTQTKSMPLIR